MNKKVSIVTGTWNRFEMVCQMVDAALAQTYPIYEVIVVDDCSPDNSYEKLLEKYQNNPIVKIFKQEKNTGGVPNWNSAIDFATGEIVAWCSDDDRLFEWHIEKAMDFLEKNTDVDVVHAAFINIQETENFQYVGPINDDVLTQCEPSPQRTVKPIVIKGKQIVPYYTKYYNWPFHPSTLVFKKSVWENVGKFNPEFELADSEWFIRIVLQHKVAYLPYYGVLNRRHDGNWSSAMGSVKMQVEVNTMMQRFIAVLKKQDNSLGFWWQCLRWKLNYQEVLLRIFISRTRFGMNEIALNAADELRKSSLLLRLAFSSFLVKIYMFFISKFKKNMENLNFPH